MFRNKKPLIPSLLNEIDEFRDFFDIDFPTLSSLDNSGISIYEDEKKVYVEAHLPGVKKDEININFEKGTLWIKAETKREDKEEREKKYKYHLKAASSFSYRLPIPSKVDESKTPEAIYQDGILKVIFEKGNISKTHKIEIK
jgi:HSP20 family protein